MCQIILPTAYVLLKLLKNSPVLLNNEVEYIF